jgi:hypothetical protein
MIPIINVFVSSTWIDMAPEREAIEEASRRLRLVQFVGMEYFGARSGTTREVSLEELDRCQVYVGVLGHRWGSGITEAEYRHALTRGLPCLIYQKRLQSADDSQSAEDAERQVVWRNDLATRHTVALFDYPAELATRLVADLHNLIFDQLIVHGIGQLHRDYDVRIQRFLAEYLGTQTAPVPFGGRVQELGQLDSWIDDPDAAPYALVVGPAGRGKSALLVHWARQLATRNDLCLVFFPISIRFRTNLASVAFASIAARLAALHGEPLLAGPETPVEAWRELVSVYLRRPAPAGKRLLLVLDGADEGGDWQPGPDMFPATPPDRLRVLVSARYLAGDRDARGWITRLGWDRPRAVMPLELAPLSPSGLVDVLRQSSVPLHALSTRVDVIAELFRLTAGDPLLIGLYVSDLWTRGAEVARLQPEDLEVLQSGLEGYFRRWWDDQRSLWGRESPLREPAVNAVLNALSCALGPLRTSELLELMPDKDGVAVWALDDIMQSLKRFVVGDGNVQGYAFSHPRLAEYFYGQLANAGHQAEQEGRFVQWGRDCLARLFAGRMLPSKVPTYLLNFLRPHFDRAVCAPEDYLGLSSNAWAQAWERLDRGSYGGFLADLRRVCEIATCEDDARANRSEELPFLGVEVRSALFVSSVATQAADMPASLLRAMVERQIWSLTQAIAHATRIPNRLERLRSLLTIVAVSKEADHLLAAAAALAEIRRLLGDPDQEVTVSEVLRSIAAEVDPYAGPGIAGRIFEVILRLSQQSLSEEQRAFFFVAARDAASYSRAPAVQRAILWSTIAAVSASPWDAEQGPSAIEEASAQIGRSSMPHSAERLFLLRHTLDHDKGRWRLPALCAGAQCLASIAAADQGVSSEAWRLLVATWQMIPSESGQALRSSLVPILARRQLETLLGEISRLPQIDRVRELRLLLHSAQWPAKPVVARWLKADDLLSQPASRGWYDDVQWLTMSPEPDQVLAWLEAVTETLPAEDCLSACAQFSRCRPEAALRAVAADKALLAIDALSDQKSRTAALAALLDLLQPEGTTDSFENWRREVWRTPKPAEHSTWALRQMLSAGRATPQAMWPVAQRLATALVREAGDQILLRRFALVSEVMAPETAGPFSLPPGLDAAMLLEHRDAPERLAEVAMQLPPNSSLIASLSLLANVIRQIPSETVHEAVTQVLAHEAWTEAGAPYANVPFDELIEVPALLTSPALQAPCHETTIIVLPLLAAAIWSRATGDGHLRESLLNSTPLPDALRQILLVLAMEEALGEEGDGQTLTQLEQPLRTVVLTGPPDELVTRMLSALRRADRLAATSLADYLVATLPAVRARTLPRWLEAAAGLHSISITESLAAFGPDSAAHFGPILEGVGRMTSSAGRARWLIDLVERYPNFSVIEAVSITSKLPDARHRLQAWCALLPALPVEQRSGVLVDALRLVVTVEGTSAISRNLVQMAIDLDPRSTALLNDAVAAMVAMSDGTLRNDALAALASVLPPEQLASALVAGRRIGDAAERVRAMRALAEACLAKRSAALEQMLAAIRSIADTTARTAALLYVSALLPQPERWPMLEAALLEPLDLPGGFRWPELLNAVADAVVDAPAKLAASALIWLGRRQPSQIRTNALLRIMFTLPDSLRVSACVLISTHSNHEIVNAVASQLPYTELQTMQRLGIRLPVQARAWLDSVATRKAHSEAAFLEATALNELSESVVGHLLRNATRDLELHSAVRHIALGRAPSASRLAELARATRRIGDHPLRHDAIRRLAAHAARGSLTRAADAVALIEPCHERAIAQLRLAARQAGWLRENLLEQALVSALSERDPRCRLGAAVACAVEEPGLLSSVLDQVLQTPEAELRTLALRELLLRLPDEFAAEVAVQLTNVLSEEHCIRTLIEAARSGRPLTAASALAAAGRLQNAVSRARVLAAWAPCLHDGLRNSADDLLLGIGTDFAWVNALIAMTARWPDLLTPDRAAKASQLLVEIADDSLTFRCLLATASAWPTSARTSYLRACCSLREEGQQCQVLTQAIHACNKPLVPEFIAAAREFRNLRFRSIVLGGAAICGELVDEVLLAEALQDAAQLGHYELRIVAIVEMAEAGGRVPAALVAALLKESREHPIRVMQAFCDLASKLEPRQVLLLLKSLPWGRLRSASAECATLLSRLAPRIGPYLPALLDAAAVICQPRHASALLVELAQSIEGDEACSSAVSAALSLSGEAWRARALIGVIDRLDESRQKVALTALMDTSLDTERARRLAVVRPKLADTVLQCWRTAAASIRLPELRAMVLALEGEPSVVPFKSTVTCGDCSGAADRLIDALLEELPRGPPVALSLGARHEAVEAQASTLARLLMRLPSLECEDDRYQEIMRSIPSFGSGERLILLGQLEEFLSPRFHDLALAPLVTGLEGPDRKGFVTALRRLPTTERVGAVLRACQTQLGSDLQTGLLEGFRAALQEQTNDHRSDVLSVVAAWVPVIVILGGETAAIAAIAAISDVGALWT